MYTKWSSIVENTKLIKKNIKKKLIPYSSPLLLLFPPSFRKAGRVFVAPMEKPTKPLRDRLCVFLRPLERSRVRAARLTFAHPFSPLFPSVVPSNLPSSIFHRSSRVFYFYFPLFLPTFFLSPLFFSLSLLLKTHHDQPLPLSTNDFPRVFYPDQIYYRCVTCF